MARATILVVDDENDILTLINHTLAKEGYDTVCVGTGEAAIAAFAAGNPDAVILDLMLPGIDGLEICRRIKSSPGAADLPILMLTAKSEDTDMVLGLEMGADDYITKPFSPKVLVARLRAALRRREIAGAAVTDEPTAKITIGALTVDLSRHEVRIGDQPVALSATEFNILVFLAKNPGWVFSRDKIIDAVKGKDYPVTERSVDVQILGLRKKLGDYGSCIKTVRGVGYRLEQD